MPQAHLRFTYTFDELSEQAKERAREWYREGALDYEWWNCTYEDAEQIGLKITEFDLYHLRIKGTLQDTVGETVRAIVTDHGRNTDTYKLARHYYARKHADNPYDEEEFTYDLLEEYLAMLRREYEWLLSDECVDESIEANDYEFDENGNRTF